MTAVQIFTRRFPQSDDCEGQIIHCVNQAIRDDPFVGLEELKNLLLECITYKENVNPNVLRPTAIELSRRLSHLLTVNEEMFENSRILQKCCDQEVSHSRRLPHHQH